MRTMLDVSAAVGEADGGTAWVRHPDQRLQLARRAVPGAGAGRRVRRRSRRQGLRRARSDRHPQKVDGGWRVTGKWYYNSGSWHATWAALGIPITDEAGEVVDQGMALIPRTDLDLEDTWFVAGMKSSGSNCLIAEDVFVPEHRVMLVPRRSAGSTRPSTPTRSRSTGRHSCRSSRWSWSVPSWEWAGRRWST